MEKFYKTLIFAGVCLIGVVYASSANAATFQSLGFVNGASSAALEVSGDGSTVVGTTSSLSQAFVWTASQGMMPVSPLSGSTPHAILWGVNYDGSIAVGSTSTSCCGRLAATWTHADGLVTFDKSDPTFNTSRDNARAISDDGRTVVGYHQTVSSSFRPLVWVDGVLATPTDIPTESIIQDVSADGTVMAGYTGTAGSLMAFVWSAADGYRQLTLPAEGQGISTAWGVSADGNTVVGRIATPSGSQAYRWSDDTGVVPLGILADHTESVAFAASADGRIVVGNSSIGDVDLAVIWDEVNGLRSLKDVLELDFDLDLSGWVLTSANSVSYDGSVIVGSGINPDGIRESWIVTSIPLPAGVVLFVSALGILGLLRHGQA